MIFSQHYLLLKSLHIFGIILFLGNIIVTGFWKACADYSKDWRIICFSQRLVTYTDLVFTSIGVLIILVTGLSMARQFGQYWHIKWIRWGLALFISSGIIWVFILIPLQITLHRITTLFYREQEISNAYWRYENLWLIFGLIATLLPLMNLYWMVFKPI